MLLLPMIAALWALALSSAASPDLGPEAVRIESAVRGRQITWRITNVSAPPIVHVDIPAHHVYDHRAPPGWTCEESSEALTARAGESYRALTAGRSGDFAVCGTSSGTVLADGVARVTFADGQTLELPAALTFVPESQGTILLVPAVIAAIVAVHLLVMRRRRPLD